MSVLCCFLDVGQGASQIIRLGSSRAIVIDTGTPGRNLCLTLLKEWKIRTIEALILTHDHSDHTGGAIEIIQEYKYNIKRIYFNQGNNTTFLNDFECAVYPLIIDSDTSDCLQCTCVRYPMPLYKDSEIDIELLYPSSKEYESSINYNDFNYGAGIVLLRSHNSQILFSSDAPYSAFEKIYQKTGKTLSVDIATIPHHGGDISATDNRLLTLYATYLKIKVAIISVGTSNSYGHPQKKVIQTVSHLGTEVFCTQITSLCCPVDKLEYWRTKQVSYNLSFSKSSVKIDKTVDNNQEIYRNIACAGTIEVLISDEGCQIVDIDLLRNRKQVLSQSINNNLPCMCD